MKKHTKCRMNEICRKPHRDGECERNCYYNTIEVKTKADCIRALTDEELAGVIKNPCDMGLYIPNEWCKKRNCGYQCSLDWLKQEVDG